jgi:glycosyltransferase involved in cell wall biosynthesis
MVTGTETYTREVCRRLPGVAPGLRWRFFASRARAGLGVDVMVLPFRRLWSQVRLPIALAGERPDLLFVPGHVVPFAWPGKAVTVVHDLAFVRHPEAYSWRDRSYLHLTTRWALTRCKLLIAISESTKLDLVETYGVAPERVRVVRVETRKNQAAALAAVERLDGVTLVVAGPERDRALSEKLRSSTHCRVLGMVDQPMLELLYKRAGAVVVPSLYEGFGLPVLEAMARGKVVVAAKASSLPEVGGEAALYFHDASDPQNLAGVLEVALGDQTLRTKLARAARARAAKFTWEKTAAGVAEVIKQAVAS